MKVYYCIMNIYRLKTGRYGANAFDKLYGELQFESKEDAQKFLDSKKEELENFEEFGVGVMNLNGVFFCYEN